MRSLILVLVILLFTMSACSPAAVQTVLPTAANVSPTPNQAEPASTSSPQPTAAQPGTPSEAPVFAASAPATSAPAVIETDAGYSEYTSGSLWLRLSSPSDEEMFTSPQITVAGQAPAETVISVNEEILVVGEDEVFSFPLSLDEGPNVIELVASSPNGDVIELVLTVVYEKE